jgi:hypothetical protein
VSNVRQKTRSVTLDKWNDEQIESMERGGNALAVIPPVCPGSHSVHAPSLPPTPPRS